MTWIEFNYFAIAAIVLLTLGSVFIFKHNSKKIGNILILTGILVIGVFIVLFWNYLTRPPLRTLGETRLWYSFFIALAGFVTYLRWGYQWISAYSNAFSILFLILNMALPETHDKTLMPALQSPFFPPHVIVYILAYSILGASSLVSFKGLYVIYKQKTDTISRVSNMADNLVYTGFSFLTLGLILGALWAKEAWGHYWTWDPKETWALMTWLGYLIYIHFRYHRPQNKLLAFKILAFSFIILLVAWFGINYLPAAQTSVHVYSKQ